ncbi:MAG: LD-carboxypeptidase [Sphingobacteriaceae bacterium]|nr:LD-carboxypeptidase [Sphingobacteriaceae bacterium]
MKTPAFLKKGDTVLIIATARKISEKEIEPAVAELKKWGLKIELGANLFKSRHQFAGTDLQRASDLQWAIDHPVAKAVFIARGGYGTIRILDQVRIKNIKHHLKWFVGFSDVTAIHTELNNKGIPSIHGPMPFNFLKDKKSLDALHKVLFGIKTNYNVKPNALNRVGKAEGEIVGGNLSLLYALAGTDSDLSTKNKILFLEDLDEYLYHLDRMMMQLKRNGKLKKLKGLIVGGFTEMKDNAIPFGKTAQQIILEAVAEYDYPVCFDFPAGHVKENFPILLGKTIKLEVFKTKVNINYPDDVL